jgi:prepilin-type N-terminal cleavage/methylation domain-containing protein
MKQRKQQAFTLVETLMAVAIVGLIMASVYGTFHSVVDVTETAAEAAEQVQRERIAIKTLEDAFSGIVYYEQNPDKYAFIVDGESSQYPTVSFATRVPPDFLGAKEFGSQRLRRVEFAVEDDFETGATLVMYQSPINLATDALEVSEPRKWVLGSDLFTYVLQFYSTVNNSWVDQWDETNSIPARIKVELSFKGPGRDFASLDETHKRDIVIFSDSVTQAVQNPPLPAGRGSKGGSSSRGSSGRSSSSSSKPRYTPEQIAEWRRRMEERRRSGDSGRSNYTDAQRDAYRKRMAEIYQKRMASRRGDGPPAGPPGGGGVPVPPAVGGGAPSSPPAGGAGGGGGFAGVFPGENEINDALIIYFETFKQPAPNLDALADLPDFNLPAPPPGMEWQYNQEFGEVTAVRVGG